MGRDICNRVKKFQMKNVPLKTNQWNVFHFYPIFFGTKKRRTKALRYQ